MTTGTSLTADQAYEILTEEAGYLRRPDRAHLKVHGPETYDYLQGQVTNDVGELAAREGRYAALLNPKGRILTDLRVLAISPEEAWLEVEGIASATALRELSMYRIGRRVEISDASHERITLSVIGPSAWDALTRARLVEDPEPAAENFWVPAGDGIAVVTDVGADLIVSPTAAGPAREALEAAGVPAVPEAAAEVLRIERGRPRYGVDMSDENLPGEAGIVDRAVSFTKGCYVGQEPVARMFHKGHPNRHLRGLALSAAAEPGAAVSASGKEVGRITSAGVSPAHGPIALAILRREVQPGDEVETADGATARVVELPFRPA